MEGGNAEKGFELQLLPTKTDKVQIKAFKRRWIIMIIYMYYACIASLQWIEYCSITNIIVKYYKVSTLAVDWTSIVYMAVFPIMIVPASIVTDKQGLRTTGLIGCILTFIGTTVKVFSIRHDLFWVVLLGQTIVSIGQVFIIALPPKLASVWFKSSEISTACSLGVFGSILGVAIGYVLPPMIVQDSENMDEIGYGLKLMCWMLAASMVPVTIAILFYFPKQPPLPPSITQATSRGAEKKFDTKEFFVAMKDLFRNKGFVIHAVAFSINLGVFSAIGTLLNQFILQKFEGATEDVGKMGFLMIISGMIAVLLFGVVMDKTRKYKEIALFNYLLSAVSIVFLMYSLKYQSKLLTYINCCIMGFSSNAYMPVSFELAVELTFPAQEGTTTGILMACSQILGVGFTIALGYLNVWMGGFWSLATQAALLFLGTLITALVPNRMLRQEATESRNDNDGRKASHHS